MGQVSNIVTTSPSFPVNAQIEGGIDTVEILKLLLSRTNTREKTMAENSAVATWSSKVCNKIVSFSIIVVASSFILEVNLHMGKIVFLFALVLILISKDMKVFVEKLFIPQFRS